MCVIVVYSFQHSLTNCVIVKLKILCYCEIVWWISSVKKSEFEIILRKHSSVYIE